MSINKITLTDVEANQVVVFEDGTTLADITKALGWYKKEKARLKAKDKKRVYKPTGNPVGRPKKVKTEEEVAEKKPRGRPRKVSAAPAEEAPE
jgi:hypothetical protein